MELLSFNSSIHKISDQQVMRERSAYSRTSKILLEIQLLATSKEWIVLRDKDQE